MKKFKLTGKPNIQNKAGRKLKSFLTKENINNLVKGIIREELKKFYEGDTKTAPAPSPGPAVEPDVKPAEKPRRRTLNPPAPAPEPKPKAKTSSTVNNIVKRYRNIKNEIKRS